MTPQKAYKKCVDEKKRIPEMEKIILKSPKYSYFYVYEIIKARWEQGESVIITDPEYSYYYARNIIKGPWELAEKIISINPQISYWYARDMIKGPFEECHNIIFNSNFKDNYIKILKRKKYDYSEWLI